MSDIRLIVMAKAPAAGRSKTRLSPPCTPSEAATLAEAALADTLATVARPRRGATASGPALLVGMDTPQLTRCDAALAAQRDRLSSMGLRWAELPSLRHVDSIDDARAVAREAPQSRFARTLAEISPGCVDGPLLGRP